MANESGEKTQDASRQVSGNASRKADWQLCLFITADAQSKPSQERIGELLDQLANEPLIESSLIQCEHPENNIADILGFIACHLPDVLILEATSLSAIGVDITEWCRLFREQGGNQYRPVLLVLGGSREEERIAWMLAGADDVINHELTAAELSVRLLIQLRRHLESTAHPTTQLPGLTVAGKILQRRMNRYLSSQTEPWALLLISLEHFEEYEAQYGHLAASQVLRSFSAILLRSVILPDFIGQSDHNDFLILTHPDKASKIATLLCRQFEAAVPNFYSDRDRKQGYLTSMPDETAYRRIPFIRLSIGIISAKTHNLPSFLSAYHRAGAMRDLARQTPGNYWVSDSPQLSGEKTLISRQDFPILVVESDAAMAYLLKTTLQMDAYLVEALSTADDALKAIRRSYDDASSKPIRLVILDAVLASDYLEPEARNQPKTSGLQLCQKIKKSAPQTAIICISSIHQREMVLRSGADIYLPKPFEMRSLFLWVERLLGI
ncbi:MAG: response regulator [Vampirovibrionales bacterium]|nr:response regulator [Vampirovibrionales bacterium]